MFKQWFTYLLLPMLLPALTACTASAGVTDDDREEYIQFNPEVVQAHIREALDEDGYLQVLNRTPPELREALGEPLAMARQGRRDSEGSKEAWVYHVYPRDATGLYIFFENGQSVDYTLDSFNGISGSYIERWFRPE